jgi:L-cysteine desulfidase
MDEDFEYLLEQIKGSVGIATGCTEPAAIALNCAVARKHAPGRIEGVDIKMDMGLLKNAMFVGIPGAAGRGVKRCAALGITGGNPDDGMNVLGALKAEHEAEAETLLPRISVSSKEDSSELYIETVITTDQGASRVITYGTHDHIALVEHPPFSDFIPEKDERAGRIKEFTLPRIKEFADTVDIDKIAFLKDGIRINRKIAEKGMEMGFGKSLSALNKNALWGDSLAPHVQALTGAASFARMSGLSLPVMIATGSGNQGITLFLTVAAAAEKLGTPEGVLLRALALALGINLLAKAYLGTLAPICACGAASGLGAAAGIVYLLDGTVPQMMGAVRNMAGGITGMICDGAKEGCANKVSLSAACAALSAMTAVSDFSISPEDGILAQDIHDLFQNVEYLSKTGMKNTNQAILHIMTNPRHPRRGVT